MDHLLYQFTKFLLIPLHNIKSKVISSQTLWRADVFTQMWCKTDVCRMTWTQTQNKCWYFFFFTCYTGIMSCTKRTDVPTCTIFLVLFFILCVNIKHNSIKWPDTKGSWPPRHKHTHLMHLKPGGRNPAVGAVEMLFAKCACLRWSSAKGMRPVLFCLHSTCPHFNPRCAVFY